MVMKRHLAIVLALCIVASLAVIPISAQTTDTPGGCVEVFKGPLGRKVVVCYETTVKVDHPLNATPGEETNWVISMKEGTSKLRIYFPLLGRWYERSKTRPIGDKIDLCTPPTPIGTLCAKGTIGISTHLIISGPGTLSMSSIDWKREGSESFKVDVSPSATEGENVTVRGNFDYFVNFDMSGPFGGSIGVEKHINPETVVLGTMKVSPTPTPTPNFKITNLMVNPSEVKIGEKVSIIADVKNIGDAEGTYNAKIRINGATICSEEVTLSPEETKSIECYYTPQSEGNYEVEADGLRRDFNVIRVTTPTPLTPIPDSDGDGWDDEQERRAGTNPYNVDTDGDGIWDSKDPNPLVASTPTPTTPIPAFQIIPAIVALVGVAYLFLLRRRK